MRHFTLGENFILIDLLHVLHLKRLIIKLGVWTEGVQKLILSSNGKNYLYEKPIFEETHHLVNDYANGRTLDADYIKKNFPKDYYKENPDGSIDVNLTLYFKPQSYFYL